MVELTELLAVTGGIAMVSAIATINIDPEALYSATSYASNLVNLPKAAETITDVLSAGFQKNIGIAMTIPYLLKN